MGSEKKITKRNKGMLCVPVCSRIKKNSHTQNTWKEVIELHTGFGYNFSE